MNVALRRAAMLTCLTALLAAGTSLLAACTSHRAAKPAASVSTGSTADGRPNIIFVLTDDLAMNLVQYMPHVQALAKAGTSFSNYTVTDSLCCPSRAATFTGQFPHDNGVFTNTGPDGGFNVFHKLGDENSTFATDLQKVGYRTAMMGKYLNLYQPQSRWVPPGWSEWDVAGVGYPEYNYNLNENKQLKHYGSTPADYLTEVLSAKASAFVTAGRAPFFIEVATFAPHEPYTPAPRDANSFPGLKAPRGPAFDRLPTNPPTWLSGHPTLAAKNLKVIDTAFRKRVQAVQSVDRMIASLQATVAKAGIADNTVIMFTSDNGYHLGEYRLNPGKQTAFDTDIHVPLVAAGPGIKAGAKVTVPTENIDLRPTFDTLGRAPVPSDVDGHSLLPLLRGTTPASWRTAALIEHHGPDHDKTDPDLPRPNSGNPTTYQAMRTLAYTWVEYADGEREFYDRRTDPNELHNTAKSLTKAKVAKLHAALHAMTTCHGHATCR